MRVNDFYRGFPYQAITSREGERLLRKMLNELIKLIAELLMDILNRNTRLKKLVKTFLFPELRPKVD